MDYLDPGLGLIDTVIDKHFDRIPTKVFDKDTYKPKSRRSSRRNSQQQQQQQESSSGSDSEDRESRRQERRRDRDSERNQIPETEEFDDMQRNHQDIPRHSGQGQTYTYGAGTAVRQYDYPSMPIYSNDPPRLRPQYVPTPPPGQGYPPPLETYSTFSGDRGRDRNHDSDDDYYAKPARSSRRPRPVTRRSSSYHGPRDRRDYNNSYGSESGGGGQQLQRRRHGSEAGTMEKAKDVTRRYGVKEEVEDVLTTSKAGLAGSAVGAVVGGWAANKAQIAYGKDRRRHESASNPFLTLLGAAAGGLAADVLVARYEDQKKETKVKEKKWENTYGDNRDEGRRGSDSGRRRRRDSYSD